ncbi:MAG TPA: serine hydrolase domain-containing protein [Kineosporiaceae bacterium]|nr:serine hydrolase domain-containing protein [Kineosporiaceae bacterium]
MGQLSVEVDPAEVGFDPGRLARIGRVFDRYVEAGRLPGWLVLVARHGRIAYLATSGRRHLEAGLPVEPDTLWRIFSMTKPITSVATMMLYEEGAFELTDPVSRYLPAFADQRVYTGGSDQKPVTVPATEPVRIWHLLTHTAGLTYGFHRTHPVDAMLRARGWEWGAPAGVDLAAAVDQWASFPLLFQPGTEWNYSYATDVLGRLVEVVSGSRLDDFFATRILRPLGMTETAFQVAPEQADRLARLYLAMPGGGLAPGDVLGDVVLKPPALLSGGGGLVSTAGDYHRFAQFLLNQGELDGVRLLGSRTVRYMTRNHLPGGADLEQFGRPIHAESPLRGVGFGLGFAVVQDPARYRTLSSAGEFNWGGAASTAFWVDPAESLTAVFMTQLMPSTTLPLRTQLRQLVYQALVDRT